MRILAFDSSARAASAAVTENGEVKSEIFTNTGLTHSQTIMPMADAALRGAGVTLDDIDCIAVNNGPGSFTGVRIGVAAVKGLAQMRNIPCAGISTLESLAYNLAGINCTAVCAMDARCAQVYTAAFSCRDGKVERLSDDEAVAIKDIEEKLKNFEQPIIFVGDGAKLCYNYYKDKLDCRLAGELLRYQRASSTAVCAGLHAKRGETVTAEQLMPLYLRLPQAERELRKKEEKSK